MREPASMAVRAAVRDALADVPDGATDLAGVSGGADSLALAAALAWVAERRPITAGAISSSASAFGSSRCRPS